MSTSNLLLHSTTRWPYLQDEGWQWKKTWWKRQIPPTAATPAPLGRPRGAADVALALLLSALFSADPLQTQLHPTMWLLSLTCNPPTSARTNSLCYDSLSDLFPELPSSPLLFFHPKRTREPNRSLSFSSSPVLSLAKDEKNKQTFVTRFLRWFFWKCVLSAGFIRKWQQDVSEGPGAFHAAVSWSWQIIQPSQFSKGREGEDGEKKERGGKEGGVATPLVED